MQSDSRTEDIAFQPGSLFVCVCVRLDCFSSLFVPLGTRPRFGREIRTWRPPPDLNFAGMQVQRAVGLGVTGSGMKAEDGKYVKWLIFVPEDRDDKGSWR